MSEELAGGARGIPQDEPKLTAWEDPFDAAGQGEPPGRYDNEEEEENGGRGYKEPEGDDESFVCSPRDIAYLFLASSLSQVW